MGHPDGFELVDGPGNPADEGGLLTLDTGKGAGGAGNVGRILGHLPLGLDQGGVPGILVGGLALGPELGAGNAGVPVQVPGLEGAVGGLVGVELGLQRGERCGQGLLGGQLVRLGQHEDGGQGRAGIALVFGAQPRVAEVPGDQVGGSLLRPYSSNPAGEEVHTRVSRSANFESWNEGIGPTEVIQPARFP